MTRLSMIVSTLLLFMCLTMLLLRLGIIDTSTTIIISVILIPITFVAYTFEWYTVFKNKEMKKIT